MAPYLKAQIKFDQTTTIDVNMLALLGVFEALSRLLGYGLVVAPEIQRPATNPSDALSAYRKRTLSLRANVRYRKAVAFLSDGHNMDTMGNPVVLYNSSKCLKIQNVRL